MQTVIKTATGYINQTDTRHREFQNSVPVIVEVMSSDLLPRHKYSLKLWFKTEHPQLAMWTAPEHSTANQNLRDAEVSTKEGMQN